jgi:uncharacterized protein (TIGR02996 family)
MLVHSSAMASKKPASSKQLRNASLEAAIVTSPESPDAYLVYGDWLLEAGEPLGELVTVQAMRARTPKDRALAKREAELLRAAEKGLGELAEWEHTWAFGFLESLIVPNPTAASYVAMLERTAVRFLRELDLDLAADDDEAELTALFAAIVEHGVPPALRKLALLGDSVWSRDAGIGDVSVLYPRLASIRELTLRAPHVTLGAICLPMLETFLLSTTPTDQTLSSLASAHWPKLESLSLGFRDAPPPGSSQVDALGISTLQPLLDRLPPLKHLGLSDHAIGDDVVSALLASKVLAGLTSLDLSRTAMTDEGAKRMLARPEAFEHLESIDLRTNELSAKTCRALEKALSSVDTEEQGERDDPEEQGERDDHYDGITE